MLQSVPLSASKSKNQLALAIFSAVVAFMAYTAVYAFRKPFSVVTYGQLSFWGIRYQTLLILSQGLGYMGSKFCGITFIGGLKRLHRWKVAAVLMTTAWLCLLLLALVPAPWGMLCMLGNGFVLGFMWGIVFSYIEGRQATDFIASVLAVSFIFAGGFTRSAALWLRDAAHIPEQWLAFATALVFVLPMVALLYLLEKLPPPTGQDVQQRTARSPMTAAGRKLFVKRFGPGVIAVTVAYIFLTIMRDVRDNFMVNIFAELGYGDKPAVLTQTETNTSIVVLLMMSLLVFLRSNIRALGWAHVIVVAGFLLAGVASALFVAGYMSGLLWMQLAGLGLYMGYIPFNCIFFERLIAAFKIAGNVGFLIYVVDAWGYLGSLSIMLWKELFRLKLSWVQFYPVCVVLFSVIGVAGTVFSWMYFNKKYAGGESAVGNRET
jgi:hypothetical protein